MVPNFHLSCIDIYQEIPTCDYFLEHIQIFLNLAFVKHELSCTQKIVLFLFIKQFHDVITYIQKTLKTISY
jgi:hypothetical protein